MEQMGQGQRETLSVHCPKKNSAQEMGTGDVFSLSLLRMTE